MTDERLAELTALCEAATLGKWFFINTEHYAEINSESEPGEIAIAHVACEVNAEFIAAARQALPELIEEVKRLESELEVATRRVDEAMEQVYGQHVFLLKSEKKEVTALNDEYEAAVKEYIKGMAKLADGRNKYKALFIAEQAEHLETSAKVEALESALSGDCRFCVNVKDDEGNSCGKCNGVVKFWEFDYGK